MSYGLTAAGFNVKPPIIIEQEITADVRSIPGFADAVIDADSVIGNFISIMSEREALLWGLALSVYQSAFRETATAVSLDRTQATVGKARLEERRSTVTLTLTNDSSETPVTVPAGSQARQNATGVVWETLADAEIPAQTDPDVPTTVTVAAQSLTPGPFEASIGSIDTIVTAVSGWDAVSNAAVAQVGQSQETDDEFRVRAQTELVIAQGSTVEAVKRAIRNVPGVTYVAGETNRTPVTDGNGNRPNSYRFTVVGGTDQAVIDAIGLAAAGGIDTNGTVVGSYSDPGDEPQVIRFDRVTEVNPYFILNLTTGTGYPADGDALAAAALEALQFEHGQDLINHLCVAAVSNADIPGLLGIEVLQGLTDPPTLSDNIAIPASEVVNITLDRITVNAGP
jgi:uncharacterized phage protein gp47/JayE